MMKALQNKEEPNQVRYETDDEDLERETGWTEYRKANRKKRKANTSPETSPTQTVTNHNNSHEKKNLPQPIFVSGVKNFNAFKEIILQSIKSIKRNKF